MKIFYTLLAIVLAILGSVFFFQKNQTLLSKNGFSIEKNISQSYSIITLDTTKVDIMFGGVDFHQKDPKYFSTFHRHFAKKYLEKIKEILPNTVLVINGQFFNAGQEKTHMSFPLKSNGKIINDYMDNDIVKRTLLQTTSGEFRLYDGYDLKDASTKELIVGFSPKVDASSQASLGRNYAVLTQNSLIFFLANAKTQAQMEYIITKAGYSLDDAIMFDGGPSAQYASDFHEKTYYGDWEVPQFFVVGERK